MTGTPRPTIRVAVCDASPPVRSALAALVELHPDLSLAGVAVDGPRAIELAQRACPDVLLLGERLPGLSGAQALPLIHDACPDVRTILYSSGHDAIDEEAARAAGAFAVADKRLDVRDLIGLIRQVAEPR
jgi:DNA-binding NarL/FixJ family response regulator